jgi:hypothetical protein
MCLLKVTDNWQSRMPLTKGDGLGDHHAEIKLLFSVSYRPRCTVVAWSSGLNQLRNNACYRRQDASRIAPGTAFRRSQAALYAAMSRA